MVWFFRCRLVCRAVDIRSWVSGIMTGKWLYGYRCDLIHGAYTHRWYGVVYVPRWHPVRLVGLDDLLVQTVHRGVWSVFTSGCDSRFESLDARVSAAYSLRVMQVEWDRLSPYEREYLIR